MPQGSILDPNPCFSINVNEMTVKVCSNDGNSEVDLFAGDCNAFEIGETVIKHYQGCSLQSTKFTVISQTKPLLQSTLRSAARYINIIIRAARFIMRIKYSVPEEQVLHTCNWNSMEHYYKKSITCKTHKIYNNITIA